MSEPRPPLRLVVRTPTRVVVDEAVRGLVAEDRSGSFGLRPGCEPVVSALVPGVLAYRLEDGSERFVAVGSGTLDAGPCRVDVAVREAVPSASLDEVRLHVLRAERARRRGEAAFAGVFRGLHRKLLETLAAEERAR